MNQNFILHNLLLMLIIFSICCYTDKSFSYFKANLLEAFQKTPKVWHSYIRMFLHIYLKENQCKNFKLNIFQMLKHSLILLKLKDKSWESNGLSSGPENRTGGLLKFIKRKLIFGPNCELTHGKINDFIITWPSGKIDIIILQSHLYKFQFYYYLYFYLNSKIRLNVTFISLILQDLGVNCDFDKLEIIHLEKFTTNYRYCGKYSRFIVYPLFFNLIIHITLESQNDFKLKCLFSVIDDNLIFSPITSFPVEVNFELQPQYYKVGSKHYLTSFFLRVTKLHNIKLLIKNSEKNNFVIYDGPGFMFKILNTFNKKSLYITSTFQCLLQFIFNSSIKSYNQYFKFMSVHHFNIVHKKLQQDVEMILKMPCVNCQQNICILYLQSPAGYQINFTLLSVISNSQEFSNCLLQGITIGELSGLEFFEMVDFCPEFDASTNQLMRSFYTKNQYLCIVLYWYHGYSTISATLTVTTTKCKGVKVDLCYYNLCLYKYRHCIDYFDTITKSTNLTIEKSGQVSFSMEKACVVLMVKDWKGLYLVRSSDWEFGFCFILLKPSPGESTILHAAARLYKESKIKFTGTTHQQFAERKPSTIIPGTEISISNKVKNNEIVSLFITMCWARRRHEYVNIVIHTLNNLKYLKYISTTYSPGTWVWSLPMIILHESKYMTGTDRLLTIVTNMTLSTSYGKVLCHIRTERTIYVGGLFAKRTSYLRKLRFKFECFVCDNKFSF